MMNTKWWSLLFLLTGLVSLSLPSAGFRTSLARVSPISISVQAGSLKPAEMQADFDLMRKALEEAHTGLYRYSTRAEMNKNFESQRAKLTKEMTSREFINLLRETLAHIRCGHTNVSPDPAVREAEARIPMLPLRVNLEGTRLFVLLNESAENQTIVPGMEILEINGKKVR